VTSGYEAIPKKYIYLINTAVPNTENTEVAQNNKTQQYIKLGYGIKQQEHM